jgi:hypothetical protein
MNRRWFLVVLASAPGRLAQAQLRSLAAGEILRGRFKQERQLKGFDRPLISTGDFVLDHGLGLIWRTEQPFAIMTVITAAGLVQSIDGEETTRLAAARLPFLARLYDLLGAALSGDWRALDKMFQVTRQGDAGHWEIVLAPHAGADPLAMPLRSVTLRGGQFLDHATIVRLDGDSDQLVFSDQILGTSLTVTEAERLREARK